MLRNFGFPALAVAVLSMPAFAADLPSRVPAPVFVPPPAFVWSGVYIGATAGYAKAFHHYDDLQGAFLGYPGFADARSDGFALGGTLGINFQAGSFVYGIETDLSWLNNETTYVDPNGGINNFFPSETNKLNYLGTVRGRLGLAVDRTLIYFTAGLAYADVQNAVQYNSFRFPTSNVPFYNVDTTQFGWVVGAGVEYALAPNWTIKGEALYADLGAENANWTSPPPGSPAFPLNANYNLRWDTSAAIIRGGVNYKFDWLTPAPVIARY
jgi:outer membrane immunogenic protein